MKLTILASRLVRRSGLGLLGVLGLLALGSTSCHKEPVGPYVLRAPLLPQPDTSSASIAPGEAVVYEAFVRDASAAGTFDGLIPRLDSIKSLGCNVLWLMPIHPIGVARRVGTLGSPYAVQNYTSVNPDLGDIAGFDRLVAAAHARNLVVILDWVANHTAWDHPWTVTHRDWYTQDAAGNLVPPVPTWQDVADLDYSKPELRREMIRSMRFWVRQHNVDGFRCDAAEMVPNDFWKEAIDSLSRVRTKLFWLAEAGNANDQYDSGFRLAYGWPFYDALKQVFNTNASARVLSTTHTSEMQGAPAGHYRLRFTTNHDYTYTEGPAPEIFGSAAAAQAAYVATLAYGATPLIYNGQEAGDPTRISLFEKRAIQWNTSPATTTFYRRVLGVYNSLPALRTGSVTALTLPTDMVAVQRTTTTGERAAVFVNVRNQSATVSLPAAWQAITWTDALTNQPVAAPATVTLPPYGYAIWRSQ